MSERIAVPAFAARTWPWLGSLLGSGIAVYLRSMLGLIVIWYLVALTVDNHAILPTPWQVAESLWQLLVKGEIFDAAGTSLWRLALSFVIAAVGGIPLGILMGLSPLADELIDPVVELLRPISGIAWLPLALFIFGVGNELPIFIMTYVALFPILLNTLSGVRQTDPTLIRAARTMGASGAGSSSARSSCRRRCRASWSASGSPAAPAGRRWSRPSWSARRAVSASRSSGIASS